MGFQSTRSSAGTQRSRLDQPRAHWITHEDFPYAHEPPPSASAASLRRHRRSRPRLRPRGPPPGDVVMRFIDTDPETVLATSDLVAPRFEADLGPTTPAAAELWRGHDVLIHGVRDGALEIEQDGDDPWLAIDTALDADAIVAVEVELANPGPAEVQLFWAGRWQRFSMKRMARPTHSRHLGSGTLLYSIRDRRQPRVEGEAEVAPRRCPARRRRARCGSAPCGSSAGRSTTRSWLQAAAPSVEDRSRPQREERAARTPGHELGPAVDGSGSRGAGAELRRSSKRPRIGGVSRPRPGRGP